MFGRELWHRRFLEFKFLNEFSCGLFLILIAEITGKGTIKLVKRLNLPPSGRPSGRGDCGSVWPECRGGPEPESERMPPQLKTFYYAVIATCVRIDETLGTLPIGIFQREQDSYGEGFRRFREFPGSGHWLEIKLNFRMQFWTFSEPFIAQ